MAMVEDEDGRKAATVTATAANAAEDDNNSDVEIEGMDMSEDEEPTIAEEEEDGGITVALATNSDDDDKHEKKDLEELEAARNERKDLLASELTKAKEAQRKAANPKRPCSKPTTEVGEETTSETPLNKFQYLVGQSEVYAHFLAGERIIL